MNTNALRHKISDARLTNNMLAIDWADGHSSLFHAIWLRHQCTCNICGTPVDAVRGIRLHHISRELEMVSMETQDNEIRLTWANDDHFSTYNARWLRDHCYSESERSMRKYKPVLWDRSLQDNAPKGSLIQAEIDPAARLSILEAVRNYGFCRITDAPTEADEAQRLINIVGPQRQTNFGTYTLKKKKTVENVGDTTSALDPHVDEAYRLSAIGITVFQVLHPSSNGGDSTLVDGFEAVRRLRETWPEDFDLLCRVPIISQRLDKAQNNNGGLARWYMSRLPVIKCDYEGDISGVRLNERQISPLDIEAGLVEPCYRALRRLYDILYDPALRLTFALKAGEGLLFDNQRLLHGRTAFTPEHPARSVLTSSVDLDEFHSSMRLLHKELDPDALQILPCQGMAV